MHTNAKILMLSTHGYVSGQPELGKPDTGGQVVFVLELAKQFAVLGHSVDIVTRQFDDQPAIEPVADGVRICRIPYGGPRFVRKEDMHDCLDEFVENFIAWAERTNTRYNIIDSHYWDAGWAGQAIAVRLDIPHVHTPHSLGWWKRAQMKCEQDELGGKYRFAERIEKETRLYAECQHVIATSQQQLEIIRDHYAIAPQRMTMIPPGIDKYRYRPLSVPALTALRTRLGMTPSDVYAVGRAAYNKGYDLLIGCLSILRKIVPDARLVLAAGANSEADCNRVAKWKEFAAKLRVSRHIVWKDYIADADMPDYYRAAGVFALCSRYEPFGMTAAEAMACGTPTVLTVHGGLQEQIEYGRHALFADPHHTEEYATALSMPLQYPRLRERLATEGARFSRKHFGWGGIALRTLALFSQFGSTSPSIQQLNTSEYPQFALEVC